MSFRQPPRPPRQRAMPQPVPEHLRRTDVRMVTPALLAEPPELPARGVAQKQPVHRKQSIRDSARDEACLMRLPGCIGHTPGSTIWSHYRGSAGGKGMSLKSSDSAGCYACTHCDAVYDGQRPRAEGWSETMVKLAWHEAHIRSLGRLHAKGLL